MKDAKLSLETAKALYNEGGAGKQFALDNYSESELIKPRFDSKQFLLSFFNDFVYKVDRIEYPNVLFFGFDKEGNYLFEYNFYHHIFWFSSVKIWSTLGEENGWCYEETEQFCKDMVEEHFKLKDITTLKPRITSPNSVEEHFKLKDITTEVNQKYDKQAVDYRGYEQRVP